MMNSDHFLKIYPSPEELSSVCSKVKCPQRNCGAIFRSTSNLNMHLIKHHKVFNNGLTKKTDMHYYCPVNSCLYFRGSTKPFTKLKYLKQHFLKVHAVKEFACKNCDKKFSTEGFKISHMKHCGNFFFCTCGAYYTSNEAILTHCKRKGSGHSFIKKSEKTLKSAGMKTLNNNEQNLKKSERLLCPKLSSNVSFPIHYIAAIALSELSSPCNAKLVDKGIQTDSSEFNLIKEFKCSVLNQKGDKKRKSSQQTQTTVKFKKLKISAQTQTNTDYLRQKVKPHLKCAPRKKIKSMETQTKEHIKLEGGICSKIQKFQPTKINQAFTPSIVPCKNILIPMENDTPNHIAKIGQKREFGLTKSKESKSLWDTQVFTKDIYTLEDTHKSEDKTDLFNLEGDMHLCDKEVNLNEYSHITSKNSQYVPEQVDNQMFDLNKLCNIETQTEIDTFLTDCGDDTFTLCSTTETQTTDDFDSLLYSNMCTQTCEEVDQLFNFNFVNIETQTTWPDLDLD